MKRSNVNVIIDNAINSQDYYRMYSSRDFYRGTSFKMAGAWTPDTHYFNDEHIIDFISCEGALLYCLRGHLSSEWNKPNLIYKDDIIVGVESNPYWAFIMGNSGKGQKGDKGDIGPIGPSGTDGITPQLKIEDGRWLLSMDKGQTWQDIGQATGDPGQNGTDGKNGSDGIGVIPGGTTGQALVKKSDADYDTEWKTISEGGEIPNFDAEVANVSSTTEANANVVLEGDIFKFSFGLPKGADGKDGEDGKDGTNGTDGSNGEDGLSIKLMYAKSSSVNTPPIVNKTNTNPGSVWTTVVPIHTSSEIIWSITASFRNSSLVGEWSDPVQMTGEKGQDAVSPNWKTYVYKLSDSKPSKPTGNSPSPSGWEDYPTTSGNWWQCIGTVNGETGLVTEWSEVIPVNGRDGQAQDGKFTEFRFAVNTSNSNPPTLNATVRTPSGWSVVPPEKSKDGYLWMTTATINPDDTLNTNWTTPVVISGENGTNGTDGIPGTPGEDGRTTYFHIKYSAVANPTSSSQMTETPSTYIGTYVDFTQADSTDPSDYTWARFEGIQGEKGEQGIPGTNGEDGKTSYLHIKYSNDGGVTFTGNNGEDPGAWIGIYVDYNINDSDDPSDYKWTKIKGEPGITGDPGPAGKDGVDGLPGIGIEVRYCLGTTTIYGGTSTPGTTRQPTGWNLAVPTPTEETPYIWFIQARVNYTSNTDKVGTIEGSWSTPTKLSGTNGLNGENGSKGQIIYPEGIYNVNTVYQGTADKTPYVYDSNDASYYVLNIVGTWQGTLHSNESPSTDTSNSWVKLDAFEALYTKIGIIANGLIGSAVFNGNYMFSQQGIDSSGQVSTQYQNFNPETPTGGVFTPNILFNFRTGAGHMAAGKIKFGDDGSVDLTNIKINNALIQNTKQYTLTQSSDPHVLDSLYSEIVYSPTIHEDVILKIDASKYQLNIDGSYSGAIYNKSDKQLFVYPFDNGRDDESIKICGYYNGRLLFSYDEPILFNASQILLPAGGVVEFKFVPSSIVSNYYVGTIWVENTSDFELKTWKQNGTLRSDLYYRSYDDYNSDSFLACGEVYFNSSGVPSLSGFYRCRTDLVLTVSQSGNFAANLNLTSIYPGRTLSITTVAISQPIWDGALLKMFYGSARGRINGAFLDIRTADGKVPTTSISVPFLILGSK